MQLHSTPTNMSLPGICRLPLVSANSPSFKQLVRGRNVKKNHHKLEPFVAFWLSRAVVQFEAGLD